MITAGSLAQALQALGYPEEASRRTGVSGGCIANGTKLSFGGGRSLFVKQAKGLPDGIMTAEARGLAALREAEALRVPEPLAVGSEAGTPFLVLEWIESGPRGRTFAEDLGRGLANLHRESADGFGFEVDNFIGSTPQTNGWMDGWVEFFAERRLRFQLQLAVDNRHVDSSLQRDVEGIIERLSELLPEPEKPSLIHGDLWGGNFMSDNLGRPVLIDPATYYGHREADLAMTRLFGGFPAGFYTSYEEHWPLEAGFERRVDLYNLYHLLNHLNLFGSGYLGSVREIVRTYA